MLMPRKVAHRKHHRGRTRGMTKAGSGLSFGEYGIQAMEPGWITARQIEAARIAMTPRHQARRQGVDQRIPGQAGHEEARRDPHGFGQGQPGVPGSPSSSPDARCSSCRSPTRPPPESALNKGDSEAADQVPASSPARRSSDGARNVSTRPATER